MTLQETINVNPTIEQLKSLLLDFEQYPRTGLLLRTLACLQTLTQKLRRYFQLKGINGLVNEMIILLSAAAERRLTLTIDNVELALQIADLIGSCCNLNCTNVNELAAATKSLTDKYSADIKQLTSGISLLQRTLYLKFDSLRQPAPTSNTEQNDSSTKADTVVQTPIDSSSNNSDTRSVVIDKKTVLTDSNQPSSLDLPELSSLIAMLKSTIDIAADNTIKLTQQQVGSINKAARGIKELCSEKSAELLDGTAQQLDKIDDFLGTLSDNMAFSEPTPSTTLSDKTSSTIGQVPEAKWRVINDLLRDTITLTEAVNYNDYINESISGLRAVFEKLALGLQRLQAGPAVSVQMYEQLSRLSAVVAEGRLDSERLGHTMQSKLMQAGGVASAIYLGLNELRTRPFGSFTIGLQEYVELTATAAGLGEVALDVAKPDVLITADLWPIFDIIIPWILRHIVLFNFEISVAGPKITLEPSACSGVVDLFVTDNGKPSLPTIQTKRLRELLITVQEAGGKTYVSSGQGGSAFKFRFQQEHVMSSYLIVYAGQQYYGIPAEHYLQSSAAAAPAIKLSEAVRASAKRPVKEVIEMEPTEQSVLVSSGGRQARLIVDKVLAVANLSAQRLTGTLGKGRALGAAVYGDKSVLLLDIEQIIDNR